MLLFVLFVSFVVNTAETTTKNTKSTKKIEPGFQPSSISVPSVLSVVKSPPIFGVKVAPTEGASVKPLTKRTFSRN
jgi:hypothetical protein